MVFERRNIVFFHPDLGIGGAERLVIDAAVGLQDLGHNVTIYTSHCDPKHCFDETCDAETIFHAKGTLDVRVRGNTIIPPSVLGRFAILCAILRQIHLVLQISLFTSELKLWHPSVFFIDQLSASIPLLRLLFSDVRVLFYCHFPDKLLSKREGWLKALYRGPFDWLESWSTGCSDTVVVNSRFTKTIFDDAFPGLRCRSPKVVYPCVDTAATSVNEGTLEKKTTIWKGKSVLLSINRFERKKNVSLAIRAFAGLPDVVRGSTRLVVAGGYDPRMPENVSHHSELCSLADTLGLRHATAKTVVSAMSIPHDISVLFLLSVPNSFKTTLLNSSRLLVYTPRNEHFGIVPLEAMLAGVPVLAANEGGPTETVVEGQTGWLRDVSKPDEWTTVMQMALPGGLDEDELKDMGRKGRERARAEFSKEKMATRLQEEIWEMMRGERSPIVSNRALLTVTAGIGLLAGMWLWWFLQ